jgi:NSS family neurotransmitter:Na+ symporter
MGPTTGRIVGGGFFLLLCFAALTSTISLLEVPVAFLVDEKKWSRHKAVSVMAVGIFLVGLPSMLGFGAVDWLTDFVHYEGSTKSFMDLNQDIFFVISLPLGGFLLSLFISVKWKTENLGKELTEGNPNYPGSFWEKFFNLMIRYVCPVVLGIMFILTLAQKFFGLESIV